jgi:hypothetical protein
MAYIVHDDVFRVIGLPTDGTVISEADVDAFILEAEDYVQAMLGTYFDDAGTGTQVTEVYDGNETDTMFLKNIPIVSLDSVTIDSTSVTTSAIWLTAVSGKIQLKSTAEVTKFTGTDPQLVSIQYTYGKAATAKIEHYTAVVAGMMTLIAQIGGTFDDVTNFSLPHVTGSLGEPYTNIREALSRLEKQEKWLRQFIRVQPHFG